MRQHQTVPLVHDLVQGGYLEYMGTTTFKLLVQQYDSYFMLFILIWLAVYILAALVASRAKGKWLLYVLSIGTGVLIIAPLLYRLAIRIFILARYGW